MKQGMQESYEKGVANHSAPSFALGKEPIATQKPRKSSKGQRVGYVRVSTLDQNEKRQLERIELDRTFLDKASGKNVKRPQLAAMPAFVR
jgi:hypothetical protein